MSDWEEGTVIYSRDGAIAGRATGSTHKCRLDGCRGVRVSVKWPDGQNTFPCSGGLTAAGDGEWIIA